MLSAVLKMSGYLILRLIYGKEKAETMSESLTLPIVLSMLFMFWVLCLFFFFTGSAGNDFWLCIIYVIGFPTAMIVWYILVKNADKNR